MASPTLKVVVQATYSGFGSIPDAFTAQMDMAGDAALKSIRAVTTAGGVIDISSVPTPSIAIIQNLDATNSVQIGTSSSNIFAKLMPSSVPLVLPMNSSTLYAIANTAAVNIAIAVYSA